MEQSPTETRDLVREVEREHSKNLLERARTFGSLEAYTQAKSDTAKAILKIAKPLAAKTPRRSLMVFHGGQGDSRNEDSYSDREYDKNLDRIESLRFNSAQRYDILNTNYGWLAGQGAGTALNLQSIWDKIQNSPQMTEAVREMLVLIEYVGRIDQAKNKIANAQAELQSLGLDKPYPEDIFTKIG